MSCKILLALAIVLTISDTGNSLKCYECGYKSNDPKANQKCGNTTVDCTTSCYSTAFTLSDGTYVVVRNCDSDPNDRFCPDAAKTCREKTKQNDLKSCAGMCCKTDRCNDYTPSSATGVVAAKITLCVMLIAGLIFA